MRGAWSDVKLLRAYAQRRHVESFHRRVKQQLGLGHLYRFQPVGIELELEVVVLDQAIQSLRLSAGLAPTRWRPNTPSAHRRSGPGERG